MSPAHLPPQQELLLGAVNSELFLLSLRKSERLFLYRRRSPVYAGSGLMCSKLARYRKPHPQKVDNHHINIWARIAHSLVLNTLRETTDPRTVHPHTCPHPTALTHSLCCLPPTPTHTLNPTPKKHCTDRGHPFPAEGHQEAGDLPGSS